ncbi:MAG: hypothetical protein J2P50_01490 [Hyphomicrobiaceae bacterium]|nr:hypothetical protein [Hyphomicrobiaceae bacterium]
MRHILGVLGVIAASILLGVSALMNYRFGMSLGKTPTDQQIYGMASAAADCFKALAPFFFFAAIRNRVWSQAIAAALVWVVVTGYAMTSALGHAALNRLTTSGERAAASASYKDLRADSERAEKELKWIPAHRPAETVAAELNVLKAQRLWLLTNECADITTRWGREFCQQYYKLSAEYASAQGAQKLEARIAQNGSKIAGANGATVMAEADPQASVLARFTGLPLETVQASLTLFVALLIEIGSGFGMYVAFAYWRPHQSLHGGSRPLSAARIAAPVESRGEDAIWSSSATAAEASGPPPARPFGDNDNRTGPKWIMPENDVELFYKQAVELAVDGSIVSQDLYDGYKLWAKGKEKRPLNHARFSESFEKLGYKTVQIAGRQRYIGITLTPGLQAELEKKASFRRRKAQQTQEAAAEQPRRAVDAAAGAAERLKAAADEMRPAPDQPETTPGRARAA